MFNSAKVGPSKKAHTMSFWNKATFAFQQEMADAINEEIWSLSAKIQELEFPNLPEHGAQQAMVDSAIFGPDADGLVLPWVPDVLGSEWQHQDTVHVVGSAYAGFIEKISRRSFPFGDYLRTSRKQWHDFARLYLECVIRGDGDYYEPLGLILESFGSASRFSLFDLCRASLVTRTKQGGPRWDKPISLATEPAQRIFASHVNHQKSQEWTWARLTHTKGCVVALAGC